jgi:hypothetical protein
MILKKHISQPRWLSYQRQANDDDERILACYLWNIQLCEALYPSLHLVEVVLRNQMDAIISQHFGEAWLSEHSPLLADTEQTHITKAKSKLKPTTTRGHLVAELPFGFWTGLFRKHYRNTLWHQCIKATFPYLKLHHCNPSYVHQTLNDIRRLRNRVFHHEPIWKYPNLPQKHQAISSVLGWMSPDLSNALAGIDRFSTIVGRR